MDNAELWQQSAKAWVEFVDRGDANREGLLDEVMLGYCGDVQGLQVLDVGCGEGRFCRKLAERGASVTGVEPTQALLMYAQERHPEGNYVHGRAESLPVQDGAYDLVVSYLSLVDTPGFDEAIGEYSRVLRAGGRLALATLHPMVSTHSKGWTKNAEGHRQFFEIHDYVQDRPIFAHWAGIEIVNYHRSLSRHFAAILASGLELVRLQEPAPSPEAVAQYPNLADQLRVPNFMTMLWQKPTSAKH